MRRLINVIVGMIGLLLLIVGAPAILWTVGKDLVPDQLPSLGEVWDALMGQDTGRLFIGALVLIGAAAWVIMIAALVLEIPAVMAGRSHPRRIKGMGWAQRTASVLLFMVITGSVSSNMVAAQTLPPLSVASISTVATVDRAMTSAAAVNPEMTTPAGVTVLTGRPVPTYTVEPGESTWSIAEKTLGSGDRTGEILALNVGKPQPDGGSLTANNFPHSGWILQLPADARTAVPPALPGTTGDREVSVVPGDTLSGIAQRELGDAAEYPSLAAVNHLSNPDDILAGSTIIIPGKLPAPTATGDREVPVVPGDTLSGIAQRELGDAAEYPSLAAVNHLSNPDDILAGSTIIIPTPASSPTGSTTSGGAAKAAPSAPSVPAPAAAPAPAEPPAPAPGNASPPASATVSSIAETPTAEIPAAVVPAVPATQSSSAASPEVSRAGSSIAGTTTEDEVNVGALIGISALTAAALWAGLLAARHRSSRGRRPGRQSSTISLSPAEVRTEKRLRERAAEVDVPWLDLALRSLGTVVATHPGTAPDITAAFLSSRGLRLKLAAAQPAPAPFVMDGDNWWLSAAANLPITAAGAADQMAPLPTLTSVGTLGAETVLVDLERLGSMGLQGDDEACRHLMTHMATELAHQSWSDGVNVTLVGWGQNLVQLNPDRLTYSGSLHGLSQGLMARVREVTAALSGLDTGVVKARSQDVAGDSWTPQVLLIDATGFGAGDLDDLHQQLSALSSAGRVATAVVMRGGSAAAAPVARANLTSDGTLTLPVILGADHCAAAALTDTDLGDLLDLFVNAEQDDKAIPPSALDEPWAAHMDDSGALIPPVLMDEPVEIWEAVQQSPRLAGDSADNTTSAKAPERSVDPSDLNKLKQVLAADPALDDDVSEWNSVVVIRPRVAILGPAQIIAPGETPKRHKWFTEVGVYLALHRKGVNLEKFAADLWPLDGKPGQARAIATSTRNETASKVRKWMGTHPETGAPFVPLGTDKYYRLDGRLLDVELFQRLRERGDAKAAAGVLTAIDDYVAALNMVRGAILPEASGTGWGWLANEDRREDLKAPGWVVDAAHRAVQVALTAGDLDRARWAANLAHDTDPYSDVPLLDLLVIAAQAGDMATANKHAWEVVWANEKDVPEELPTETFQVINRIFPTGLRAVGN